jgi:hypothetical protein
MPINMNRIRELAGLNEAPVDDRPEDERLLDQQVAKERAFGIKLKQAMNGIDVFRGEQHSYNFYWSEREIEVLMPDIHSFTPGDLTKLEELMGRPIKQITVSGEFSILFGF